MPLNFAFEDVEVALGIRTFLDKLKAPLTNLWVEHTQHVIISEQTSKIN